MGLPLFVAKVESDIPHKCPHKSHAPTTSPPRTNIRREPRTHRVRHVQDPAGRFRRLLALEQNARSIRGTADLTSTDRRDSDSLIGESRNSAPTVSRLSVAAHIASRFQEADNHEQLRDLIDWFQVSFGRDWHERDWQRAQRDLIGNYWNIEEPTRTRFARLVRIDGPPSPALAIVRGDSINILPASSWPRVNSHFRLWNRSPEPSSRPSQRLPSRSTRDSIRERTRQRLSQRGSRETLPNGLGDRIHSPSPEAWDTLLSTLTPDPQPPSVNSSFASTAASQTAGVSTNTSLSERYPAGVLAPDGPCDSGNEDSDEGEEMSRHRLRRAQPLAPQVRHHFVVPGRRSPLDAVTSYMRQHITAPGENFTLMFGIADADTPDTRSEEEDWRASEPYPDGTLPGFSEVVRATGPDAPEVDATEDTRAPHRPRFDAHHGPFRRRYGYLEPDRLILDRLQNNEEVPDELWAAAGVRPSWERDGRE